MTNPRAFDLGIVNLIAPLIVAGVYIVACSFCREPQRRQFNAIVIAGAGAAYLNGGLGPWEFAFTPIVTWCAFRGLSDYRFIGVGWLLHTGWDTVHHRYGTPIVPFVPDSSFGCAICDLGLAAWCFAGGPSALGWFGWSRAEGQPIVD